MKRSRVASLSLATLVAAALGGTAAIPSAGATGADGAAAPTTTTKLHGVSAASETDAWAVGFRHVLGAETVGLTRHWDGGSWQSVPAPHPLDNSFLWGVADISPGDAWAVGESIGGAMILPLAEHWNGSDWQVVELRDHPGIGTLNAVSATGADDVWMVGTGYPSPRQTPRGFIAHWDGKQLERVRPAAITRGNTSELTAITAVAADDVWAVGAHGRHGQTYLPLVEHYDGNSWTVVTSRGRAGTTSAVAGVDATSSSDAWTVGWTAPSGQPTISAQARHFDGTKWTDSPVLTPGYSSNLTSVSSLAADDVWAVGTWVRSEQDRRALPLVEHWDGKAWSIVAAPSRRGAAVSVESVSMANSTRGFAVGESDVDGLARSYLVQWDGASWSR